MIVGMKEKAYFEKINSKKIFYIFTESEKKGKNIVIISHGFRASNIGSARKFVKLSRNLAKNGISSIRFDQFGSGNSEGGFYQSSFNDWVRTIKYFTRKYISNNYKVGLFGSSMGATAAVKATEDKIIRNNIINLALWVPDPKIDKLKIRGEYMEEKGQRVKKNFWVEAENCNFFKNLKLFEKKYFVIYGEKDKYIAKNSMNKVIETVKAQGNEILILKKENHDSWSFENINKAINKTTNFFVETFEHD